MISLITLTPQPLCQLFSSISTRMTPISSWPALLCYFLLAWSPNSKWVDWSPPILLVSRWTQNLYDCIFTISVEQSEEDFQLILIYFVCMFSEQIYNIFVTHCPFPIELSLNRAMLHSQLDMEIDVLFLSDFKVLYLRLNRKNSSK